MFKLSKKKRFVRRGVAAVEAAVCLPVLAVVIFGAVEISRGIFQEYNAQSCAYEIGKTALAPKSTCADVQTLANHLLPQWGFTNYHIDLDVVSRTANASSVGTPTITSFDITETTTAPTGLEDLPRGTLLRLQLIVDRPSSVTSFYRTLLGNQVTTECVFVKEF